MQTLEASVPDTVRLVSMLQNLLELSVLIGKHVIEVARTFYPDLSAGIELARTFYTDW
jgi:hypothetical protein